MFPEVHAEEFSQSTSPTDESVRSSRNEVQPIECTQVPKPRKKRITLKMIFKEIIVCNVIIAVVVTTYGALQTANVKSSKQPKPVRFFNKNSPVKDWYRGDLSNALDAVNKDDISFVMYYAPWDAECQYVRKEFEKAATILSDRVDFAAINCWRPGSECRTHHNKLSSWPILMVYSLTTRGILYKGPRDAQSMINFLELVMKPLKRVSNAEDLVYLLSVCDAVALGFTPLHEHSRDYGVWYQTALKALEYDVMGEICFAAVTSEDLASELVVENLPSAKLMLWNDTKEYDGTREAWNSSSLLSWTLEQFTSAAARVLPLWRKGFSFARFADGRPMLVLFTPMNPLYPQLPNYALLREVAMEYYNCNNSDSRPWITELIKLQQKQRLAYQQRDIKKFCDQYQFKKPAPVQSLKKDIVSQHTKYSFNTSKSQRPHKSNTVSFLLRHPTISGGFENGGDAMSKIDIFEECNNQLFPAAKEQYSVYDKCQSAEDDLNVEDLFAKKRMESSMLPTEDDKLASENLVQDAVQHYCELINFAYSVSPPVAPSRHNGPVPSIEGLACANNNTLHILAVDSIINYHFAESLGIDIKKKKDMTAAVILDSQQESQYVLSGKYSARSIREFIANYTKSGLRRTLRSSVDAQHTHHFATSGQYDVEIKDLSTREFRNILNSRGKVWLVGVCGGGCGAHVSRALGAAARLLRAHGVPVVLARLDAARHDLPWHYTTHYYPTVLVFAPDGSGEAESLEAARGSRLSAAAVTAAALRVLPVPHTLSIRLELCSRAEMRSEQRSCLRDLREHLTSVINRNLQYWRRSKDQSTKDILYIRLQDLHRVNFHLSLLDSTDLHNASHKKNSLILSIESLAKSWQGDSKIFKKKSTGAVTES